MIYTDLWEIGLVNKSCPPQLCANTQCHVQLDKTTGYYITGLPCRLANAPQVRVFSLGTVPEHNCKFKEWLFRILQCSGKLSYSYLLLLCWDHVASMHAKTYLSTKFGQVISPGHIWCIVAVASIVSIITMWQDSLFKQVSCGKYECIHCLCSSCLGSRPPAFGGLTCYGKSIVPQAIMGFWTPS